MLDKCDECILNIMALVLFLFLSSAFILELILLLSGPILGIIDLNLSLNQPLMINFEMRDSNNSYNYIGPFHLWGGRELKTCVEKGESVKDCKKWEITNLNAPQYIYKLSKKYLTYNKFSTYEKLLRHGYIIKENNTCLSDLKYCGKIDTLNQKKCLPKNIDCPIQDFRIDSNPIQGYNYIKYSFNNSISEYISYTNKKTNSHIIGKISIGSYLPCLDIDEENGEKLEENEVNKTVNCKNTINGSLYDIRYMYSGDLSYSNIYQSNLPDDAFGAMAKSSIGHYLKVYKRPYIGVDLKCYNNSNFISDNYNDLKETNDSIGKIAFEYIKYVVILFCGSLLWRIPYCGPICFFLFTIGFNGFGFLNNLKIIKKLPKYKTNFNCSDEFTNSLIKSANDDINFKFKIIISSSIIQFIIATYIIGILLYIICSDCKEEINDIIKEKKKKEEREREEMLTSIN